MNEEKKTKGPWFVSSECDEIVVAEDSVYGVQVADCGVPAGNEYQPAPGEAAANAAFIARVCNSFDDLLDFVKTLENDDNKIPAWLWDKRNALIAKAEGRGQ